MARKKANREHRQDPYTSSLPTPMRKAMEAGQGPDTCSMSAGCKTMIHAGSAGHKPKGLRKRGG